MAFTIIVFAAVCALVLACAQALAGSIGLAALVIAAVVGALAASSVHIVMEWERAVVMRFGRFNRVAGPGIVFTWPVIEFYTVRIDQRVAATYFGAEETLTSDLVPVNVDAVVFWMVFSPKKAACEVEDYASAVAWMAQATLRAAIGRASLAEVACRRDQLDAELKEVLEAKLDGWGIDVIDVEVRDIGAPRAAAGDGRRCHRGPRARRPHDPGRGGGGYLRHAEGRERQLCRRPRGYEVAHHASGLRVREAIWRHARHPQRLQRGLCARRRGEGLATDDASVLQWASPRELGPEGPGRPKTSR